MVELRLWRKWMLPVGVPSWAYALTSSRSREAVKMAGPKGARYVCVPVYVVWLCRWGFWWGV